MNKLIAIVGMSGSGKSIACDFLENEGFNKIYFGGVVLDKLKEEGLEINSQNEKYMREKLRNDLGMGAMAITLLPKIRESIKNGNTVLDGLYSWDEYNILKDEFGDDLKLVCVVTDKNLRYERVSKRKERPFNRQEIEIRDISEIENLAKGGPIAISDYFVLNNGDFDDYYKRLREVLVNIELEGDK